MTFIEAVENRRMLSFGQTLTAWGNVGRVITNVGSSSTEVESLKDNYITKDRR
jgi:hypothetical protein